MKHANLPVKGAPCKVQRIRLKIPLAIVFSSLYADLALAQTAVPGPKPAVCPNPQQVEPVHLYGLWRAEMEGMSSNIALRFEKNPELAGSVMGVVHRGNVKSQCAGDVDNGVFTLEESSDGKSISATWTGQVVEGSCGKEISGTWNNFSNNTSHKFVLRKSAGWD